jgi:hypothetical protein
MPLSQGKKTVAATVTDDLRNKIKEVAAIKHWSVAQTLGLFIERYWNEWEKELGVKTQATPKKRTKKSVNTEKTI